MGKAKSEKAKATTETGPARSRPYPDFNPEDPTLPDEIEERALHSGRPHYDSKLTRQHYEEQLQAHQLELIK